MIRKTIITIVCLIIGCQHQPAIAESAKAQQFRRDVRASLARGRAEFEIKRGYCALNEKDENWKETAIAFSRRCGEAEAHAENLERALVDLIDALKALSSWNAYKSGQYGGRKE